MKNKKAQVQTIAPAILALVFAAVVLVFGLIITQEVRDTDIVTQANSLTTLNETTVTALNTTYTLSNASNLPGVVFTILLVQNNTGGETISSGNYSFATGTGIMTVTATTYNNTIWNISYSATYGDEAYTAGNQTIVGLGTFADFWEIIVLAIIITVVIGLLLVVFGGRSRR